MASKYPGSLTVAAKIEHDTLVSSCKLFTLMTNLSIAMATKHK
jgi:hypothetical protein